MSSCILATPFFWRAESFSLGYCELNEIVIKCSYVFRHRQKLCYMEENSHNEEKEEEAERIYSHTQWASRPERCFDPNGPGAIFLTEDTETDFSCARVGDIHSHTPLLTHAQTNSIYTSAMHPKCTCPHRRGVTSLGGVNYGVRETPPPTGSDGNIRPSRTSDNNTQSSAQPNKGLQSEAIYNTGNTAKHHHHHHVHFDPDVISDQNRPSMYSSFKKSVDQPQTGKPDGGSDRNELYPLCVISQQPQQIPS